jgi:hypothetical protein
MTSEDIIKWAREAGFMFCEKSYKHQPNCLFYGGYAVDAQLERFAAFVRADEREAVCRIVTGLCISDNNAEEINRVIRARGQE